MGLRIIPPKRVRKVKTANSQEVLERLEEYLENNCEEPIQILCGFWQDQQNAITYQELRQAVLDGTLSKEAIELWRQDYSKLISDRLKGLWTNAVIAGASGQPILDDKTFVFNTQTPGVLKWIHERGAQLVTTCTKEQKEAISVLVAKKMKEGHTVDELSRLIRPCIGLTKGDAQAAVKLYDSIIENLKKEHPRMKPESIQRKALDATCKYAERKHRQRAMTIAQTESAFAYNRGADEGIRQAQQQGYLGTVKKRWSTSGDDRVCSTCQALEGIEIEMDKSFPLKGKMLFPGQDLLPPAHPRCACAVEYIEVENHSELIESPMRTGDEWIDASIDDYDSSLINTNGDESMSIRLLMSHDEVKYEKNETLNLPFVYNSDRDVILYNPYAENANDYDMRFALTHENAHRVDYLFLHSWENENFWRAMDNTESLIMSNLDGLEKLLQNDDYGSDFAFNDLISSLTRGKANGMLFIGHTPEYLASDYKRSLEVFANITCIDMSESAIRKEFDGILKELYEAYKEIIAWKSLV